MFQNSQELGHYMYVMDLTTERQHALIQEALQEGKLWDFLKEEPIPDAEHMSQDNLCRLVAKISIGSHLAKALRDESYLYRAAEALYTIIPRIQERTIRAIAESDYHTVLDYSRQVIGEDGFN